MAWQGKAVGAAVGSALGPLGAALGAWIGHQLDREAEGQDEASQQEFQNRWAVFALGVCAGQANGSLHSKERKRLVHFGQQLFGNIPESETDGYIQQLVRQPPGLIQCAQVFNCIACEYRPVIVREILSILYADSKLEETERAWVNELLRLSGSDPTIWNEVLSYFDRESQAKTNRNRWLQALGLASDADASRIRKAYHEQANQYHPDKLVMVPDELKRLAEDKLKELNVAYEALSRSKSIEPDFSSLAALRSPGEWQEAQRLAAGEVVFCALCGQRNRLPGRDAMLIARCGLCYALLILPNHLLANPTPD